MVPESEAVELQQGLHHIPKIKFSFGFFYPKSAELHLIRQLSGRSVDLQELFRHTLPMIQAYRQAYNELPLHPNRDQSLGT